MLSGPLSPLTLLRAEDTGDGLQTWKVAANILNEQSQAADKGWPSRLGVERGGYNASL